MLRLPVPSQREVDGLASDLTHPLSLSDAKYFAGRQSARLPESGATRRTQKKTPGTHNPDYRMPKSRSPQVMTRRTTVQVLAMGRFDHRHRHVTVHRRVVTQTRAVFAAKRVCGLVLVDTISVRG